LRAARPLRPLLRLHAALPDLGKRATVAADHPVRDRDVRHVETGAEDDRVDLALAAVLGDDGIRPDLGHTPGYHLAVRLGGRRIALGGGQEAPAAQWGGR